LYDVDVDRKYKKHYSDAIESLGIKRVKIVLVFELLIALSLMYFLYTMGHFITVLLALLGLFFCFSYSANPLRLKARGVLSPVPVIVGLYSLPVLAGWFLFSNPLLSYFIVFVVGYALMNEGFTLVNTCEDYSEDKKEGIKTWAHIFGLKRTLTIAFMFALGGIVCILALLFKITTMKLSLDLTYLSSLLLVGISTITILFSSIEVYGIGRAEDLEKSAKAYGPKMPKWFMITRYPLLLIAVLLLM